jgi:hypothetical protein
MGSSCSILGCKVVNTRTRFAVFLWPQFGFALGAPSSVEAFCFIAHLLSGFGSSEESVSFPALRISPDGGFPSLQALCMEFVASQIDKFKTLHGLPPELAQRIFASLVAHKRLTKTNFTLFKKCLLDEITLSAYPALGNDWLELFRVHSVRLNLNWRRTALACPDPCARYVVGWLPCRRFPSFA